jgi:rRNA maturation protein Nop10
MRNAPERCPDCGERIHENDPQRSGPTNRVVYERKLATHRQWECRNRLAVLSDGSRLPR